MMGGRALVDGVGGRNHSRLRWSTWRLLLLCWMAAFLVHLAWIPNLVWFMIGPRQTSTAVVFIETVGFSPRPLTTPSGHQATRSRRLPQIELPGVAPGGSTSALASNRSEWRRQAMSQKQSWAPRALDRAPHLLTYRPRAPGQPRSPWEIVSHPMPENDDIVLAGVESRNDSLLRRPGNHLTGDLDGQPGTGGSPSAGNRVPVEEGSLARSSTGESMGQQPRASRRGGRPRVARPRVVEAPESAAATQSGPISGMQASRQAAPELAWTNEPVREARVSSGSVAAATTASAGQVRRHHGQGASSEARGPGRGGRGRGTKGGGQSSSSLLDEYMRDCMARFGRHMSYPDNLEYGLQQGLVLLEVQVRHDGNVQRVTVRRSSGFEAFDETFIRAVQEANPLAPPPPEELFRSGGEFLVLRFSMRYRNPMFE